MDVFVIRRPKGRPAPVSPAKEVKERPRPDEPPTKRTKIVDDEAIDDSRDSSRGATPTNTGTPAESQAPSIVKRELTEEDEEVQHDSHYHPAIEDALPPVRSDKEAIAEYEAFKASQASEQEITTEEPRPAWVKGKSSIYVDAFNLALDTVLEDEAHLFNTRELAVFDTWRNLDYQAQYLQVSDNPTIVSLR